MPSEYEILIIVPVGFVASCWQEYDSVGEYQQIHPRAIDSVYCNSLSFIRYLWKREMLAYFNIICQGNFSTNKLSGKLIFMRSLLMH